MTSSTPEGVSVEVKKKRQLDNRLKEYEAMNEKDLVVRYCDLVNYLYSKEHDKTVRGVLYCKDSTRYSADNFELGIAKYCMVEDELKRRDMLQVIADIWLEIKVESGIAKPPKNPYNPR